MIKTKYFISQNESAYGEFAGDYALLDKQINDFIRANNIKNVIDVKFAQAVGGDESCITSLPTALLIYKEEV